MAAGRKRVNPLCTQQRLWSVHAKKRGLSHRPGPPVHDDLVERRFTASHPDELWLTDITEHPTAEGKLCLCAVKDACSNRIVGYWMDQRMTAQLAVDALLNACSLHCPAGTTVHSDRGSQFRSHAYVRTLREHGLHGSMAASAPAPTTPPWSPSSACCKIASSTGSAGRPATNSA